MLSSHIRLSLVASLGVLLILQPPTRLPAGISPRFSTTLAAAASVDAASGQEQGCTQLCYPGLASTGSASCGSHTYHAGLQRMLTDADTRRAGQSFFGDRSRMVAALQRYKAGGNLTIVAVGGSISAGFGAKDGLPYPNWLLLMLQRNLPDSSRLRLHYGAVAGTTSQYMSTCHNVHVPANADIVFVEFALNDGEDDASYMDNQARRAYERLLRKLLNYPNKPAVVLMHAYRWFNPSAEASGQFWRPSVEMQHRELGIYYRLPQLSVKACCYQHMVEGKRGFSVNRYRTVTENTLEPNKTLDAALKGDLFFFDSVHPDGNTGHRVMGELAFQLIMDVWAQVASGYQLSHQQQALLSEGRLPRPMLSGNYESTSDKCLIGSAFQRTVILRDGFEWINEGKNPQMPKWGYVALEPEKELKIKINTKASAGSQKEVTVELGYLRSYENMGKAAVQCEGGCSCTPWVLDGLHDQPNTQTFLHEFKVSQAEDCVIAIKVLHETNSGKHKVKITGAMVSEEPGAKSFQNMLAFEIVGIETSKSTGGILNSDTAKRGI